MLQNVREDVAHSVKHLVANGRYIAKRFFKIGALMDTLEHHGLIIIMDMRM